jgi:hypothetical protein
MHVLEILRECFRWTVPGGSWAPVDLRTPYLLILNPSHPTSLYSPPLSQGNWGANQGLCFARRMLEPLKAKYGCSYADLWTFASKVSIEYMGGPQIPWRPGRTVRGRLINDTLTFGLPVHDLTESTPRYNDNRTPTTAASASPTAACPTPTRARRTSATSSAAWASTTRRWSP